MRANITALPDGTYSYDDFLDNDGVTDKPLRIALDLTVAGDRMTLDFSRSAPPCDGPLNIARSTTVACCYVALKHLFTDVPANAGCLAPIEFVIPDATLLERESAEAGRRLHRNHPARHRHDFRRLRPGRAGARQRQPVRDHQRAVARRLARAWPALGDVLLLRRRPRRQSRRRRAEPQQQPDLDRDHPAGRNPGVALSGDVHAVGAAARIPADRASIAAGSARSTRSKCWPTAARKCSCWASAASIRRSGSMAAAARALNRFVYETDRGEVTPPLVSKVTDIKIRQGQKVRLETPGGGGFGDPATRDPARVARDVRLGYVSREAALARYKVALRSDGAVDIEATAKARGASDHGTIASFGRSRHRRSHPSPRGEGPREARGCGTRPAFDHGLLPTRPLRGHPPLRGEGAHRP